MGDRSRQIADSIKRHGLGSTTQDLALRLLNRLVFFRILRCLKIDSVNPEFLECDGRYHGLFLSEAVLRTFTTKPEYEISGVSRPGHGKGRWLLRILRWRHAGILWLVFKQVDRNGLACSVRSVR